MIVSNIRERADECLAQFKLLLAIENDIREGQGDEQENVGLSADDQLARFNMWTGNIGVFADGHASLDYRVRESEGARKLMINFLETLRDSLQRATELLHSKQNYSQTQPREESLDLYRESGSSYVSSSFQGTETESISSALLVPVSAFEQTLQSVERTIDRLYRLSVAIRQPSILTQNSKAEKFPILDDGGNIIENEFADFALALITHRFPDAPQVLRERLGKGIVIRRKRFLYRQSHQRKLSTRTVVTTNSRTSGLDISQSKYTGSTIRDVPMSTITPTVVKPEMGPKVTRRRSPSMTSASAFDKALPLEKIMNDCETRLSTTFTHTPSKTSPVLVPDPPKPIPGSKEFECPYCCIVLPIEHAKASKWRRHVMQDLEPYTCMFKQCTDQRLFSNKRSWIAHMRHAHTNRWLCAASSHNPCSAESAEEYDEHMWSMHKGSFTAAQLPLLRDRSKVPTLMTFKECPLCGHIPTINDTNTDPSAQGSSSLTQNDLLMIVSEQIMTHLAGHLESLSIRALPWQDVSEDGRSKTVESEHADKQTDLTQDGSGGVNASQSELLLKNESGTIDNDPIPQFEEDGEGSDENQLERASYEEEWNFIPRPDYHGQDRDPVLQTMLKELYLNTASSIGTFSKPKLPVYLVPLERNEKFFARDRALHTIEETLCPDTTTAAMASKPPTYPRCFAIHGPGGMGKTQLAAQFVANHHNTFDAILWVHAENATRITQDFKDMAIGLGIVSEKSPDANDLSFARDALKRWLVNPVKDFGTGDSANASKASWLLVFDNVEDGNVLNDFWPYNGPGSILITSRNPNSWSASLELKPFSTIEATEFLLQLTNRDVSDEERMSATALARRLDGFPLALAQMGGIISHKNISFSEFLHSYQESSSQQELLSWSLETAGPQLSNYEHNVASVWAFDRLDRGTMLLNILSMLEPDGVPENIFTVPSAEDDSPDIIELKENYKAARNELLARSLVSGNRRDRKLIIHRLVQDVARTRMGTSELRKVFYAAVSLMSGVWPFEPLTSWRQGVARWTSCEELFPNVQRLKDTFQEISPSINSFEDYQLAKLLIDAGWYLYERGRSGEALVFTNVAQSICESMKLRLVEHPEYTTDHVALSCQITNSLSEINHNRGCIALETNEPTDALQYLKIFNNTMVKEFADQGLHDDMRLAISWNELGNAYMLQQKWADGEKCFLKSIEEMQKLKAYESTLISLPLVNLGLAHWLQGKNDKAIAILIQGLRDREAAYGVDDRISFITGRVLHALGNVKHSQGLFDESFEYHRRALLHHKSTLGHRHHRTADVFVRVADHNLRLHRYEMALALLDHALEAYSISQHFMPERARASFKRARALRGLHREQEADMEISKCFKIYTGLHQEWARNIGAKEEERKTNIADFVEVDVNRLVAFWSK